MPFTYCKYSLLLLLFFILLTSHSAHPITVRRQQRDAKSILTSPSFLGTRPFFHALWDSLFPLPSSFSSLPDESRGITPRHTIKTRNAKSFLSHRQSNNGGNFVIFASTPGRNGITLTNVATPNEDSEGQLIESDNVNPAPSNESELTNDEDSPSTEPSPDLLFNSDDSDNMTDKVEPGSDSSSPSNLLPIPEADVFLTVSMDPGGSETDTSATTTGPQLASEDGTIDLNLSDIDPTAEGLLDFVSETAPPEDNSPSSILIEISTGDVPEPSKAPDPQEDAGVKSVPQYPDDVFSTPDLDFPDVSPDPAGTEALELPDIPQATPQLASAPPNISDDESSVDEEGDLPVSTTETATETSQAEPSTEPKVFVDVPLSFSSARDTIDPKFDRHSREFLGETTNTTADEWKPTEVSGTVRTIQRQQGSRWEITYQGELAESTAQQNVEALERNINEGAMDGFLTDRLSIPVSVRTASPPTLNAPQRKEVSVTDAAPKETASGNATTDSEEGDNNLGVILGTCFGLLGALVLGATAFAVVRRSSRSDEPHVLDGVATAPTTIMSFESDQSGTESRFHTGAPTEPRGPNVLRNQSRILDWQMDHATATGKAKHILGRENTADSMSLADSASGEGDVSSAEVLV